DIRKALDSALASYGASMAGLYPRYAAQLLFSGGRFRLPAPAFAADLEQWPRAAYDSLSLGQASTRYFTTLPPLTFGILKLSGSAVDWPQLRTTGITGITRVHAGADSSV